MKTPPWVVVSVVARPDYTLELSFADGKRGVYDARPLLAKRVYEPLKNVGFFMQARVDGHSVIWNDAIDIAPELLYEQAKVAP